LDRCEERRTWPRWEVAGGPAALLWREWDGEYIVFHVPSGDTHLLNAFAAEILLSLADEPASVAELVLRLRHEVGLEPGSGQEEPIANLVTQFEERGLVEPLIP
jgi:PqqD family protein of HPr-rel-A system